MTTTAKAFRTGVFAAMALVLGALPSCASVPQSAPLAVMEEDAGLPQFTIYRPAGERAQAGRLPIVLYGNGGCAHAGNRSEVFLREVAANGYLVIAPGPIRPPASPEAERRDPQYHTDQLFVALDWALAENARSGSRFHNRLDPEQVFAMGRSCGGLQAIVAGGDPRIAGVVVINSGIIRNGGVNQPDGSISPRPYLPGTEADLARLHTPVLYLVGGPSDQAYINSERDFDQINGLPLFYGNMDVGHGGTFQRPGGGAMGRAAIAWLDWQSRGDATAARQFTGPDCILCADPAWTVKRKGL